MFCHADHGQTRGAHSERLLQCASVSACSSGKVLNKFWLRLYSFCLACPSQILSCLHRILLMAHRKDGAAAASPLRAGLQGCDVSDLEFDSATDPKEGGNGDLLSDTPLMSMC